jgi:anti-sigma regulatory factor (Ser/Thr protein kinase)
MNDAVESLVSVVKGKLPLNEEEEFKIRLVSKELFTNILSYSDATDIMMTAMLEGGVLTINIEDDGQGFEHEELMKRNVRETGFLTAENGRGVYLVRMMSEELKFNDRGNSVKVKLKLM